LFAIERSFIPAGDVVSLSDGAPREDCAIHWITMPEAPCTVRSTLEQVVSTARQTVHDTLGQMKNAARKSGREAVLALEQHIEKHGCK
jgi:hypothetical protein